MVFSAPYWAEGDHSLSVVRRQLFTFSTSPLTPLNRIQQNLTGRKISMSSTKFVFFRPIGKTICNPGFWLAETFSTSSSTEFNETLQEARSQHPLPSFSVGSEKQNGCPGFWLAESFSTFPLKPLNRIQQNMTERQDLNVLYQVCVFRADQKNKIPDLWLTETFWTSPHKPLKRIQQNLTGSKISMCSTKFVFFGLIRKTRLPPWSRIGWDFFNFSETAERNSTKLDRKQDLNVLYQVVFFRADWKHNMTAASYDWLRHFWLLLFMLKGIQQNLTDNKISTSTSKFVFFRLISIHWFILFYFVLNKNGSPGRSIKKCGTSYSGARYVALWTSCLNKKWRLQGEILDNLDTPAITVYTLFRPWPQNIKIHVLSYALHLFVALTRIKIKNICVAGFRILWLKNIVLPCTYEMCGYWFHSYVTNTLTWAISLQVLTLPLSSSCNLHLWPTWKSTLVTSKTFFKK